MGKGNPVVWFEIYVDDMERAQKFYETVLDVKLEEMTVPGDGELGDMRMVSFPGDMESVGKATGALVKMEGVEAGKNSTLVYFASDDCAVEAARVEAAGGSIHKDKTSIGEYGFMVLAVDSEGNSFGIHSMA